MKILFLGTTGAIPSAGDGYTSFVVEAAGRFILMDTGDNPVRALREAGVDPLGLDALVLTHSHVDHLGSYPSLLSALDCMNRRKDFLVIAGEETEERARRLLSIFDIDTERLSFPIRYRRALSEQTDEGMLAVALGRGSHTIPTSTTEIRENAVRLFYTSDYYHGRDPGDVRGVCSDCSALVHEATYPHALLPDPTGHSSALQAGIAARESCARSLYLCHFDRDSYAAGANPVQEAKEGFTGQIIEPKLFTWYTINDAERDD